MNITDELRKYAAGFYNSYDAWSGIGEDLDIIADRIDAEHKKAIQELNGFAESSELLPKDVNGEPIHIGDVMEVINGELQAKVCYMQIGPNGIWSVGLTKQCRWYDTESLRHYRPSTVEDMLKEFVQEMNENMGMYTSEAIDADEWRNEDNAIIAKYAAKLKLKESE